jgi:hypothetical protein
VASASLGFAKLEPPCGYDILWERGRTHNHLGSCLLCCVLWTFLMTDDALL